MTQRVIEAQAKVASAREALIGTARELQLRLQPKTLARDAWESAKAKGADVAEDAVDAVKRRPLATGGILAAVAMFLARAPITNGIRNLYDGMTSDDDPEPQAEPAARRPPRSKRTAPQVARKTETQ